MNSLWNNKKSPKGKDFWGPPIWTMIHTLAITLEPKNSKDFEEFLWILTKLLPCDYCKKNLVNKLKIYPPEKYLVDNEKAFLYTYIIHDLVNQHITRYNPDKTKTSPTFDSIRSVYIKGMNQGPSFWGPPIWTSIHILTVKLRQENSEDYKRFLEILRYLLPDINSRNTLNNILHRHPIDPYLRNNYDTFFYSYMIHDLVNKKLHKENPFSYDSIKSFYFSALGEECDDCKVI